MFQRFARMSSSPAASSSTPSSATHMTHPPSSSAASLPHELPVGPAKAESTASSLVHKIIKPNPEGSTSVFRAMNPELFIERTKKISPAAWLVSAMMAFAVITIGYTQWEYKQTTQKTELATAAAKKEAKEQRKDIIRRELDMQRK